MRLYRLMSKVEFESVSEDRPFSWNGKFKWFTPNNGFITNRVADGRFNNSGYKKGRYTHLVEYEVSDYIGVLKSVSNNEVMLARKEAQMLRVISVNKIGEINELCILR